MGCLLGFLGTARADDPLAKPKDPVAQEHLSQGNKLYRLRDFDKAIEEYKAGALKEDAPVFLYNLGQCYRQLGKYEDAIWHYERFLSRAQPTGDMRTAVEDFVKQMKSELDKKAMSQPPTEPAPEPKPKLEAARQPVAPQPVAPVDPWYADGLGWTFAGAGLLATGIGGYLLLDANDLYDECERAF
ncbi:MAG: tetratricopeptide repeat protein [Deltaproteobacteria bacterium]